MTLKNVVSLCLLVFLVFAVIQAPHMATHGSAGLASYNGHVLFDETPFPTPTTEVGTDNVAGGGNGGG
jgi:hypothetical protein